MPLQITMNPRHAGNLSIAANQRARFSSVLSLPWDSVTGKPTITSVSGDPVTGNIAVFTADDSLADGGFAIPASGIQPLDSDLTAIAALTTTSYGRAFLALADAAAARTAIGTVIGTDVQAYDADLAALAANSTDGLWAHTGAGTGAARTLTAPAAGLTISNPAGIAGNPTFALANDLAALEGLSANGLIARTATDTAAVRTITAPAAGITVSNGDGVSGNPTLALANDLAALEGLSSNGMIARTATDTAAVRTITGTSNHITVTNGDGVSGNPTLSRPATPSFSVNKNGTDQTGIADITFTDITWSTEDSDIGSYFSSDAWTPPAGVVAVACQVLVSGTFAAGSLMAIRILRNGTSILQGNWYAPVANIATAFAFVVATANGSEPFKVQIYMDVSSGTGTISGGTVNSYFRGAWLGPSS